jgi:hypothetical protein
MTKALNINLVFTLTLILGLFILIHYVFQVGALSKDIYILEDCERKLSTLFENRNYLDINFSKVNSLSNIEDYLAKSNFVKATQVKYIQILGSSVVSK